MGRLCEVVDLYRASAGAADVTQSSTLYQWDSFGRLSAQVQNLSSAVANHSTSRSTGYGYVLSGAGAGQLNRISYPSGAVLTHQFDATGQLAAMNWGGQPLLENIRYNALGQALSWTWAFADANPANNQSATRVYNTAGLLTSSTVGTTTNTTGYNALGQVKALSQNLFKKNSSGAWIQEAVPHSALYDPVGRVVNFTSTGASAEFKRAATYAFDANGNRTGQTVSLNGAAATSAPSTVVNGTNRHSTAAGAPAVTNAAGDLTSVAGKTIQYDTAGRVSSVTAKPVCPIGTSATNCPGTQTTTSLYNGMGQRVIRDAQSSQTVFVYGQDGHTLISQVQRNLSTSAISTTEHIYLPTASGPMPVAAVIAGKHYAVHSDQLNTPRKLTDSAGAPV